MKKVYYFNMLIAALVALLCALVAVTNGDELSDLRRHVETLSSDEMGTRVAGSESMEKAIEYVESEIRALGLRPLKQKVKVNKGTCSNVVMTLDGGKPRIVVGAHLDASDGRSRDVYNGADDNASGCAIVLALARRLRGSKPACTLEFHFYTGEEEGMKGSRTYVKAPLVGLEQYRFMLNLDMVGRLKEKQLIGRDEFEYDAVFNTLYDRYLFAERITWCENTNDSDHAAWWEVNIPAVIVHTGLHDEYHTPDDDADKIDYDGMIKVLDYSEAIVRGVMQKLTPVDYKLR